jgi:uncharacterized protein YbcI
VKSDRMKMLPTHAEGSNTCFTCGLEFGGPYGQNALKNHKIVVHGQSSEENYVKSQTDYIRKGPQTTNSEIFVEKKQIALYKHVTRKGFFIAVDPQTQELVSLPNEQLVNYLKENSPIPLEELINAGLFEFVCNCETEVKKIYNKPSYY